VESVVVLVVATLGCSGVLLMVVAVALKMYRRWRVEQSAPSSTPSVRSDRTRVSPDDYRLVGQLLTANERVFYAALRQALPAGMVIMVQVALNRVVEVRNLWRGDIWRDPRWNRIAQKSLDFVVMRSGDSRPVVAIEFDDASHERPERRRRDELLDAVLASAGLAIIHQPVLPVYDIDSLRMRLLGYVEEIQR
jgi:hypothetical protein